MFRKRLQTRTVSSFSENAYRVGDTVTQAGIFMQALSCREPETKATLVEEPGETTWPTEN